MSPMTKKLVCIDKYTGRVVKYYNLYIGKLRIAEYVTGPIAEMLINDHEKANSRKAE